jgi:hypothetical protein
VNNYGSGVSRVLSPQGASFLLTLWQEGRTPLDSELNLLQDIQSEWQRIAVLRNVPSGWLGNETNPYADFETNPAWSNWFRFGRQRGTERQSVMWAAVNGWLVPVLGTLTGAPPGSPNDVDTRNVITLDPPPAGSGDARVDFVFLEVWLARVPANPDPLNKPAPSAIYRYGNREGGFSYLPDDLVDPQLGGETSQRVQLQYRIRVVKGPIGLTGYPDGFDTNVKAWGATQSDTIYTFTNMRDELGDPGLWRAGTGVPNVLGTVDGYSYAVPLCAVFRRNSAPWNGDPAQNLNGGYNRNPSATNRSGFTTFTSIPTLLTSLSATATVMSLDTATNVHLPATPPSPVLIRVGDELMTYVAISGTTVTGLTRGVNGTRAEVHLAGSQVHVESGRPDGLFSDQVALTDILDLRHLVNPNGFNYETLLRANLDRLMRGRMRGTWKRSGAGPQGPFVHYQDKVGTGSVSLGVTKLDGPDNIRLTFSDAAVLQPVELILKGTTGSSPGEAGVAWSLGLSASHARLAPGSFSTSDTITIPISQFKSGLPSGDADQVRFVNDGLSGAVVLRIDGEEDPVPTSAYTVTPANPGPNDNLTITLLSGFGSTQKQLYVKVHVLYGPGRGLSRRPDLVHSVSYITPSPELLLQSSGIPSTNLPTRVGWAPLWSKFRNGEYKGSLPVTTETYVDPGSKTVILQPLRRIDWPDEFVPMDGTSVNFAPTPFLTSTTGSSNNTTTFSDSSTSLSTVTAGDRVIIASGLAAGSYVVQTTPVNPFTTMTLDRAVPTASGISYTVHKAQSLMPLKKVDATTAKWTTTDPLQLFSGTTDTTADTKNIYVTLPRHLVPGWGEYRLPILASNSLSGIFHEGINYMILSQKGSPPFTDTVKNYVPYSNGSLTYAIFSTKNFNPPGTPAVYNDLFTFGGIRFAGVRLFTDTRGLGREGIELPPFYGISRLFAVYEATDYQTNGSAYNPTTREPTGAGAKNLLRQDVQGPTFWIEIDEDGDSTFVINREVIDLTKSPNTITSFASGQYVIEASIFGFDRGSFDVTKPFRMVLSRSRSQATSSPRNNNFTTVIAGPVSVLPGPARNSDQIVVNYSRTPYQGDAWGTQSSYIDSSASMGPLLTSNAYLVSATTLNLSGLTRPNEKLLEVLASVGFETTLGTGRIAGDTVAISALDFRNVGYEDPAAFPPQTSIDDRPKTLVGALAGTSIEVGTEYMGCSERLPLGALFKDKDFRGGPLGLGNGNQAPLVYLNDAGVGLAASSLSVGTSYEQRGVQVDTASNASGAPGDIVVHVDGEQGNYTIQTNFRTNRGGSSFTASGANPGGEVVSQHLTVQDTNGRTNVISGRAYLVRNTVTSSTTEVSAGDELMMLVITNVQRLTDSTAKNALVRIGTNGTQEGYAAADLYRIEGHPLVVDHAKLDLDPSQIRLTRRVT